MTTQKLLSYLRQCIKKYQMIQNGDCVAVGLSGGKDSMTMLYGLKQLQNFYPEKYELTAIHVNLGIPEMSGQSDVLKQYCKDLNVPFFSVDTEIYPIVFEARKEKNPCSLCAKMRKGALNNYALSAGCNKIAYAHHKDDFIETSLMSLFFEGHYYCFPPVTHLDRTGLNVIRPMMYITEKEIKSFIYHNNIPVLKNSCPADGNTKRQEIKEYIEKSETVFPDLKKNLYAALVAYYENPHN